MKFVIAMLMVGVLALAGSVNAGQVIAGAGATVSMFNTQGQNSETAPFSLLGYGLTTNADFGSGIIPHETFFIGQYGRVKDLATGEFTNVYKASLAGVWYLVDSSKKLQPFFVLKANLENQDPQGPGSVSYLNSNFGLGAGYPISKKASLWGAFTFVMGSKISADFATGIKFGI